MPPQPFLQDPSPTVPCPAVGMGAGEGGHCSRCPHIPPGPAVGQAAFPGSRGSERMLGGIGLGLWVSNPIPELSSAIFSAALPPPTWTCVSCACAAWRQQRDLHYGPLR